MKIIVLLISLSTAGYAIETGTSKVLQSIATNFDRIDSNGDGVLSRDELTQIKGKNVSKFEKAIFEYDKNGDGLISRSELDSSTASQGENADSQKALAALEALGLKGEQNIVYKNSPGNETVLDIIYPKNKVYEKAPLFIHIHGGGYTGGSREIIYRNKDLIKTFSDAGIAIATIDYRLAGYNNDVRMNHIIQDCKDALRYLAKNSARFGIDPHKFITWGTSAGGSLALITAMTEPGFLPGDVMGENIEHTVIGCVVYFGATSFFEETGVWENRTLKPKDGLFESNNGLSKEEIQLLASPDKQIQSTCPPLLLFYGDKDNVVPVENGRHLSAIAKSKGVDVSYYEIKNATHMFKAVGGEPSMTRVEIDKLMATYVLKWVSK